MSLFVTGTDTGVGKTHFAAGLVRAARQAGRDVVGMKPFCTGDPADVRALQAAQTSCEPGHLVNPVWLHTPLAPFAAAMVENRHLDVGRVKEVYAELAGRHEAVVVEGAGGLLVPIGLHYDFADLAGELGLDVAVVAPNRLGVLNHVRLTLEALASRSLRCRAVVLNELDAESDVARATNPAILETLLGTSTPLLRLGHGQTDFAPFLDSLLGERLGRPHPVSG